MPRPITNRRYRNVVRAVMATPWAVLPEKLDVMAEILTLRASGLAFTPEEVRLRLGAYDPDDDEEENDDPRRPKLVGDVMVLRLYGLLFPRANLITHYSGGTSTGQFSADFKAAMADQRVRSILIDIDSPGGAVTGTDECARVVYEGRGQGKPIYGVNTGCCTSAAYYIGSACDKLFATPSSSNGSLGVLRIHEEISKQTALTGRTYTVLKAGRYKAAGNPYEPLSKDSRAVMEELLGDAYTMFVDAVARHRKTSPEKVQANYGEGKVMLAARALEAGMIDGIKTFDEVLSLLQPASGSSAAPPGDDGIPARPTSTPEPENRSGPSSAPTSAVTTSPANPTSIQEKPVMDKRILAALYAVGALASMEVEPPAAQAALGAFFAAHGQTAPTDVKECLAAISRLHSGAGQTSAPQQLIAQSAAPLQPVATAPVAAVNEADVRKAERARIADLEARAELLGVPEVDLQAAIESGEAVATAVNRWTDAQVRAAGPISKAITPVSAAADTFVAAASDALLARIDLASVPGAKRNAGEKPVQLSAAARDLQYASPLDIAKIALTQQGARLAGIAPEQICSMFLAGQTTDIHGQALMADGPYGTPADFPSVLSALTGKMLTKAHEISEVTYPDYTATIPSVSDFKPKTLHATGYFGLMGRIPDREEAEEDKEVEETNWIQVDSYGKKTSLTPRMWLGDELDVFGRRLMALQTSHDLTLNQLALNLITGNVTLPDTYALIDDTNHRNQVTSGNGGAPSVTQSAKIRLKFRQQLDVGGRNKIRASMAVVLVPANLETSAEQTYLRLSEVVYNADSSQNAFRGKIKMAVEPNLDAASTTKWYGFVNPQLMPAIVIAHLKGYEGGQRRSWWDPAKQIRYTEINGNFAAAVSDFRGIVENYGA